jgi:hypothetical protein
LFARAAAGVGTGKKTFLPPSAISRMARSAALLLTLSQPPSAKRVIGRDSRFLLQPSRRGFLLAPHIKAQPGMPAWVRRRWPHQSAAASSTLVGS